MVVLLEEKRLAFAESEVGFLFVGMGMSGRDHCMGFVQSSWCLGYIVDNCIANNLDEWDSVEGRVGDNIGGMLVMVYCSLGEMDCWKEKEGIEGRLAGIGEDVRLDCCTGRSVHIGKCLVAGLLLGRNMCRWVG
jgi:hypothetical protein